MGGEAIASYSTNNDQPDGTVSLEGASGGLGFRGSFTGRSAGDVTTPAGELFNSGLWTMNGSGTVGYRGGWGSVNAGYARREERVEIHEDPSEDPVATPFQRIADDRMHVTRVSRSACRTWTSTRGSDGTGAGSSRRRVHRM